MGTRVETYNTLISAGVMSPNEARKELGYNPREGGDEYVSQSNNLTFGNEGQPKPQEPVDDEA
jgi:phage portal protein BeeE